MAYVLPPDMASPQNAINVLASLWSDLRGITRLWESKVIPRAWQAPRVKQSHREQRSQHASLLLEEIARSDSMQINPVLDGIPIEDGINTVAEATAELESTETTQQDSNPSLDRDALARQLYNRISARTLTMLRSGTAQEARDACIAYMSKRQKWIHAKVQPADAMEFLEKASKEVAGNARITDEQCAALRWSLYRFLWQNYSCRRALREEAFAKRYLCLLSQTAPTRLVHCTLVQEVILALSPACHTFVSPELQKIVRAWMDFWSKFACSTSSTLQNNIATVPSGSSSAKIPHLYKDDHCEALPHALDFTTREVRSSALNLVAILNTFSKDTIWAVCQGAFVDLRATYSPSTNDESRKLHRARQYILFVVSQLRTTTERDIISIWNMLQSPQDERRRSTNLQQLKHVEIAQWTVENWILQGKIQDATAVRQKLGIALRKIHSWDAVYSSLLWSIRHEDRHTAFFVQSVVSLIIDTQTNEATVDIHRFLDSISGYVARLASCVVFPIINHVSSFDARLALKYFYIHRARGLSHEVSLCQLFPFWKALIRNHTITTETIWACLNSPPSRRATRLSWPVKDAPELKRQRAELVDLLATEFLTSKARSRKLKIRNLGRCVAHLRYHDIALTPKVSRALSRLIIQAGINKQQWMQQDQVAWALSIIEGAEGEAVREEVRSIVIEWRRHLHAVREDEWRKQKAVQREANVLRIRPGW